MNTEPGGTWQPTNKKGNTMSKTTAASVERDLPSSLNSYKESASAVKAAHYAARKAIQDDPRRSDAAKKDDLAALDKDTRSKLDLLKADQDSHVKGLRDKIERELRGNQPSDASSVLLRRDAADRVRKITDKQEALTVLNDAIANGDDSLAHAIGTRARNHAWLDVAEQYQGSFPDSADSAEALAYVESTTSGAAWNMGQSMTYASPNA